MDIVATLLVAILVILGGVVIGVLRKRKGDFAFRIKKLQQRSTDVVSQVMKLQGELEFLGLYDGTPKGRLVAQLRDDLGTANDEIIPVADRLKELRIRAASWTDWSDLYVDIGIQEEALERAEATLSRAQATYNRLEGPRS